MIVRSNVYVTALNIIFIIVNKNKYFRNIIKVFGQILVFFFTLNLLRTVSKSRIGTFFPGEKNVGRIIPMIRFDNK